VVTVENNLSNVRTEFLRVRVTPAEKKAIERAAEMEGIDISVLLRGATRKEVVRIFTEAGEENPFRAGLKKPKKQKKPKEVPSTVNPG
jgi:hypothetical protein